MGRRFNNIGSEAGKPVNGLSGGGKTTAVTSIGCCSRARSAVGIGDGVNVGRDKGVGAESA